MPTLPSNCKSRLNKFRRNGVPVRVQNDAFFVNDPDLGRSFRQPLGRDPRESLARVVKKVLAKRVVKFLKEAAPTVFTFHAAVSLTPQETFRVYIEAHFGPGLGIATCIYRTFEGWPSKEAMVSLGREIEAPYKHILSFCSYLGTTKEQWYLDDNVVVVLGCEITATSDGKLALETIDPVTEYGNLRKVILMLRRGYPRYLTQLKASLSQPRDESTIESELNLL